MEKRGTLFGGDLKLSWKKGVHFSVVIQNRRGEKRTFFWCENGTFFGAKRGRFLVQKGTFFGAKRGRFLVQKGGRFSVVIQLNSSKRYKRRVEYYQC